MAADDAKLAAWLAEQPKSVQRLVAEFPPSVFRVFGLNGKLWFLLGYTDEDELIVSEYDPVENPDMAIRSRHFLTADHVRTVLRGKVN